MGMHEGIERAALCQMSKERLVDIIMVSRYGEEYARDHKPLPLQRCQTCGALRHGVSLVAIAHNENERLGDAEGHHIATSVKRKWCFGPWEFVGGVK